MATAAARLAVVLLCTLTAEGLAGDVYNESCGCKTLDPLPCGKWKAVADTRCWSWVPGSYAGPGKPVGDAVRAALSRVYGQEEQTARIAKRIDDWYRALLAREALGYEGELPLPPTFHLAGRSGIGKSMTAKLVSRAFSLRQHPTEPLAGDCLHMVGNDAAWPTEVDNDPQHFVRHLRKLADHARRCPVGVILLDDLMAWPEVSKKFVAGVVNRDDFEDSSGRMISLKTSIVFLTSDLAFASEDESGEPYTKAELERHISFDTLEWYTGTRNADIRSPPSEIPEEIAMNPLTKAAQDDLIAGYIADLPCKVPKVRCVRWDVGLPDRIYDAFLMKKTQRHTLYGGGGRFILHGAAEEFDGLHRLLAEAPQRDYRLQLDMDKKHAWRASLRLDPNNTEQGQWAVGSPVPPEMQVAGDDEL
eukprot:TRINITY_DN8972_c0_g1_i1.p1 TRINITY_DN8972_c0_g1~~TRINITY_DN8972_c0_g1_i1.p1  ORF type:complete len:448 (+),score=123.16 TRINITY_DN8972_c0_g1_i1:92-1345(+)